MIWLYWLHFVFLFAMVTAVCWLLYLAHASDAHASDHE